MSRGGLGACTPRKISEIFFWTSGSAMFAPTLNFVFTLAVILNTFSTYKRLITTPDVSIKAKDCNEYLIHGERRIHDVNFDVNLMVFQNTLMGVHSNKATKSKQVSWRPTKAHTNLTKTAVLLLLLAGDVSPNPGPFNLKYPCGSCSKSVKKNQQGIVCDGSDKWFHRKCIDMNFEAYQILGTSDNEWLCTYCTLQSLPSFSDSFFNNNTSLLDCNGIDEINQDQDYDTPQYNPFENIKSSKGLNFLHLNTRSLTSKIPEIEKIARESNAAVICITETWLDNSVTESEVCLNGYNIIRRDRNRQGGGVCTYIREDIAFTPLDFDFIGNNELLFIQILLPKTKPIIVGTCYRPPNQIDFMKCLENCLSQIRPDCEIYILGDFNIAFQDTNNLLRKQYLSILQMFNLKQIIQEPTRVTTNSSNVLDHILCNSTEKISQSGVIPVGISDHFIIYCTRKIVKQKFNTHRTCKIRSTKSYNKEYFQSLLIDADWNDFFYAENVNEAWLNFKETFTKILDVVAPYKEIRIKQRTKKWINQEILVNIRIRDSLYTKFKKSKKHEDFRAFCFIRNKVQKLCKAAKSEFFNEQIEFHKNNPKKLWKQFKDLGYENSVKSDSKMVLKVNGENCHEGVEVANHFNEFFTTIASKLVDKLPNGKNMYTSNSESVQNFYARRRLTDEKLHLKHVSESFVYKELCNLKTNKSTGLDCIPAKFLKDAASIIKIHITYLINLSISESTVPQEFKVAKVKPLFKKKDRLQAENYRPVSILCIVSKILEKAIYKQVEKY